MIKNIFLSLFKGILAGLCIGFGGFLYLLMTTYVPGEIGKILGALLFPIGLLMVCYFSLYLYTGKIGLIFEKKLDKNFYISLPIMLAGNILATLALGYLSYAIFKNTDLFTRVTSVSASRMNFNDYQGYLSCLFKSIFCGLFVYLAVKAFALAKSKVVGISLLFFFIFAFVYLGLEHCIANSYYFSFANNYSEPKAYIDMAICILGNSIGTIPGVFLLKAIKIDK